MLYLQTEDDEVEESCEVQAGAGDEFQERTVLLEDLCDVEDHCRSPTENTHNDVVVHDASPALAHALGEGFDRHTTAHLHEHKDIEEKGQRYGEKFHDENQIPSTQRFVTSVATDGSALHDRLNHRGKSTRERQ